MEFENAIRSRDYAECDFDLSAFQEGGLTSVTVRMTPELAEITETERLLNQIALPFEGKSDV